MESQPQQSEGCRQRGLNPQREPDSDQFRRLLDSSGSLSEAPLYLDNHVDLLIDGPATYAEMRRAIDNAERYIHVETFIFADDKVGHDFADALMQKAQQGVEVRLIFDSVGSLWSDGSFFDKLRDAGVEIFEFNDVNPLSGGNPLNANVRDHRKILLVDGKVGFTGGVNFSKTYSSRPGKQDKDDALSDGWRDTHVAIYGPAVNALEQLFAESWRKGSKNSDAPVAALEDTKRAGNDMVFVLHANGGDDKESPILRSYCKAIDIAQERVWITQAYFLPDRNMTQSLIGAAKRGVDVQVILPGVSDSALVLNASRARYGKLLKAGVQIREINSSMLHAKAAVVDGLWSTVGSSNLDPRSNLHNHEVNVIVAGPEFAKQMEDQFHADIEQSRQITYAEWKSRPLTNKIAEVCSRAVAYWL